MANQVWRDGWKRRTRQGPIMVPVLGARRRLRALAVMGWSWVELEARVGFAVKDYAIRPMWKLDRERDAAIAVLYDQLSTTVGPSRYAATMATKRGYEPPFAWDDESIDDPAGEPAHWRRSTRGTYRAEDLVADVEDLMRTQGLSIGQVSDRLGISTDGILRAQRRYEAKQQKAS